MTNKIDFQHSQLVACSSPQDTFPLELLPVHLIKEILSYLPLTSLLDLGITNRKFTVIVNELPIWAEASEALNLTSDHITFKTNVALRINSLLKDSKSTNAVQAMSARIALSRVRMSTLELALESAQRIIITENERNAHPSSPYHCQSFYDKSAPLIYAYLGNDEIELADGMMKQMVESTQRGAIALKIEERFLQMGDFERAFAALSCIKIDQLESGYGLSRFIWEAKQLPAIEIALRALAEFAQTRTSLSCVKDYHRFLMEVGEVQKATELQDAYPNAFQGDVHFYDVEYFAVNNHIEKAIDIAISLPDAHERRGALGEVERVINGKGTLFANQKEILKRIRTLKFNGLF